MVNVRLPAGLHAAVRMQAEARGITDAALVRAIVVGALPEADPLDALPLPRAKPPAFAPPGIVHDLDHAREAAAEATGMLKQAARRYRESGMVEDHAEAEAVLTRMRRAATDMLDLHAAITQEWRDWQTMYGKRAP